MTMSLWVSYVHHWWQCILTKLVNRKLGEAEGRGEGYCGCGGGVLDKVEVNWHDVLAKKD